jgi:D-alanyl-D-alanine carboxypeptidase
MKTNWLTILFLLLVLNVGGQTTFNANRLDSLMTLFESNNKFMGAVSIRNHDKILYNKAFGFSNIAEAKKADPGTLYRVGSVSKSFTAVMVLQLVDEQKVTLNSPLSNYFSTIPNADKITISHLLRHRSGIHNFTDSTHLTYHTQPKTEAEILNIISAYSSDFEPDTKMEYSNSNYVLLGYIIEKITGKDYGTNLNERITKPLGLNSTFFGKNTPDVSGNCKSYTFQQGDWVKEPETDMSIPHGAGAVISTASDLTAFGWALFQHRLLGEESLKEMLRLTDNFGCGIFPIPFYERRAYGHNGAIDAFGSIWSYFPSDSVTIAVCTNGINYNFNDILIGILSVYFGRPYQMPTFETVNVDGATLSTYCGIFSTKDLPLKLTVFVKENQLFAQGTGQSSFPLEAINDSTFKFDAAGIKMIFSGGFLFLNQGGAEFKMQKE